MTNSGRVTLAQVAARSGYSATTVSMILSGRTGTRISETAAQRIRKVAAEMGYSPDPRARSLRTGRSEAIGFVSDEVTVTRFASAMLTGAVTHSQESNHVVLISECGVGSIARNQAVEALLERRVDGLVVGMTRSRQVVLPDSARYLPTIVANGVAEGFSSVLPNEFAAGIEAIDYLIERGHRRIGVVGRHRDFDDPEVSVGVSRRFLGMDQAMAAAGLSFVADVSVRDWNPAPGRKAALKILGSRDITALICANDRLAFGAYQAAGQLRLSIPYDISILSFDDEQLASYLEPGLTSIRLPYENMGAFAASWVLEHQRNYVSLDPDSAPPERGEPEARIALNRPREFVIPMPIVERGSVATL